MKLLDLEIIYLLFSKVIVLICVVWLVMVLIFLFVLGFYILRVLFEEFEIIIFLLVIIIVFI